MKLIIPMAGFGSRRRPHTWTRPKPLLSMVGRPWLDHVLERFEHWPVEEYVFIVGWLGNQIRAHAREQYDIPTHFVEQQEQRGQAHALWLAREHLNGPLIVLFVDVLFDGVDWSALKLDDADGSLFLYEVDDPRQLAVVKLDEEGYITDLIEKPDSADSKRAVMGMYYFRDGAWLARACEQVVEQDIKTKGEYYLSDAITLMIQEGAAFKVQETGIWHNMGRPEAAFLAHRHLLDHGHDNSTQVARPDVNVIPPVYIHPEARVECSIVGPYVSIGKGATVRESILRDTIIDEGASIEAVLLERSMVGRWAQVSGQFRRVSLGDSSIELT